MPINPSEKILEYTLIDISHQSTCSGTQKRANYCCLVVAVRSLKITEAWISQQTIEEDTSVKIARGVALSVSKRSQKECPFTECDCSACKRIVTRSSLARNYYASLFCPI